MSSRHHTESSCIALVDKSHLFYQDDGTGLSSHHSITPSSIPVNVLQSDGEETKHFSSAEDFKERKMFC